MTVTFGNLVSNYVANEQLKYYWLCKDCLPEKTKYVFNSYPIHKENNDKIKCCICDVTVKEGISTRDIAKIFHHRVNNFENSYKACEDGKFSAEDIINLAAFSELGEHYLEKTKDIAKNILKEIISTQNNKECFYDTSKKYRRLPNNFNKIQLIEEWKIHENNLIKKNRYFNTDINSYFSNILYEITNQGLDSGKYQFISKIRPFSCFFRARTYKNSLELRRIKDNPGMAIYAPIYTKSNSGRMNAQGVEMLYLANSPNTAHAEVDGKKCLVAKFSVTKNLNILDLTKIDTHLFNEISLLDSDYFLRQKYREIILNVIPKEISEPADGLGYVMSQAFCNFIASWEGWGKTKIHGIAYKSVKHADGGKNYVIFDPHNKIIKRIFSIDSIYKFKRQLIGMNQSHSLGMRVRGFSRLLKFELPLPRVRIRPAKVFYLVCRTQAPVRPGVDARHQLRQLA